MGTTKNLNEDKNCWANGTPTRETKFDLLILSKKEMFFLFNELETLNVYFTRER